VREKVSSFRSKKFRVFEARIKLPPVEAAYRRLRAEMNLPEPLPEYASTVSLANAMSR
jgi:hypothetical protein